MTQNVYRYHAVQKHGWRFNFSTNPSLGYGWIYDGVAFRVPVNDPDCVNIYEFHYDQSNTYGGWRNNFSTSMDPVNRGWTFDGIGFKAFNYQKPGTVPVFQYHCAQSDGWRMNFSTSYKPATEGWTHDGVAFYAYPG